MCLCCLAEWNGPLRCKIFGETQASPTCFSPGSIWEEQVMTHFLDVVDCGSTWNQIGCWIQWGCSIHNNKSDFPTKWSTYPRKILMVWLKGCLSFDEAFPSRTIQCRFPRLWILVGVFFCCNNSAAGRRWLHQLQHTQHRWLVTTYSRRTERAAFVAQWPKRPEIHCQALAKVMISNKEGYERQKSLLL